MHALQSLTKLFITYVTDACTVNLWAEDGELKCTQGGLVDGFDIEYTVNIDMTNVLVEPQTIMMHLVIWLNKFDVQRSEKGLPNPTFAVELLDNGKCDIKLKIDIQEPYSLKANKQGQWKQNDVCYECVSDFTKTLSDDELPSLEFVVNQSNDLPS